MSSERQQINSNAGIHHTLSRQILGIDWYDTESSARRVIEWLAEGQEPVGYVVEKRTGSLTALSGVIRASAILEDFVTDGTPLYAAPVSEAKAQGVVMPDVNAAAKALCNRHAMICGVDADDQWKEYSQDFIADAETVLANARLNAAPVQQVSVPGGWLVERGYSPSGYVLHSPSGSMVRVCDSGGGGIETAFALFLKAMLAAAPAAPAAGAGLVEALGYQVLFDAIAAATSVYANGAINISVQAFRDALAANRVKGVV